jgi:hypothetical protein
MGLGRTSCKLSFGCVAPQTESDAQGRDQDQTKGRPKRDTMAKGGDEPPDRGDQGVRPV